MRPVPAAFLHTACDVSQFHFADTSALADPSRPLGQARAEDAVRFGIGVRRYGFNVFVLGPPGMGKQRFVRRFLDPHAAFQPVPDDWCYVDAFDDGGPAKALRLPAGRGAALKAAVARVVADLKSALPAAFDRDEYHARRKLLEEETEQRSARPFAEIEAAAREKDVTILRTPAGIGLAPLRQGQIVPPDEFSRLPAAEQERFAADATHVQARVDEALAAMPREARRHREALQALDRETAERTLAHCMEDLRAAFRDLPPVIGWLDDLREDILRRIDEFLPGSGEKPLDALLSRRLARPGFARYEVNLVVDNAGTRGAPVVYEDHPTTPNLVGRVDHHLSGGNLVADHRMVRAGALHRANGGYLIVDARRLLQQPLAWEALKRALRARQIRIESLAQALSLVTAAPVEPEPVPLDVKVVLLGERSLYHLLAEVDPDFLELFKVAADLEDSVSRTQGVEPAFAAHVASLARHDGLRPLEPAAVARVIEHAARLAGDAERLSLETDALLDLLGEADHLAEERGRAAIGGADVEAAITAQTWRADRLRERIHEEIRRGTLLIDTRGAEVGQVNALSVYALGRYSFGRPTRVTARVRLGSGKVVDIEREVRLGGPLHSKGVLILGGFLAARYVPERPLSLSATLVFEQSYGGVDGDSASCAELLALLSAIGEVPLRQSVAVTGSVDQHGRVQPVGGVNQKIEGFFDVCRERGLVGGEGVVIPAANVKHLMLRGDVVEAAAADRFQIWAVETVDEAIEVLTGLPAGERGASGFPRGTFNQRVEARLEALAEQARDFARAALETAR
jgi:lon-related putative ATP-dependent protease